MDRAMLRVLAKDIACLHKNVEVYKPQLDGLASMQSKLDSITDLSGKLEDVHLALFAKTSDNKFGRTGFVVMTEKIEAFLDISCRIARVLKVLVWPLVIVLLVVGWLVAKFGMPKILAGALELWALLHGD